VVIAWGLWYFRPQDKLAAAFKAGAAVRLFYVI
jgi:hypothetical protein